MTNCPHCHKSLSELGLVVQATQTLSPMEGYSPIEEIEHTIEYYCPSCGNTLPTELAQELEEEFVNHYDKTIQSQTRD